MKQSCENCHKEYITYPCRTKNGNGRFCSRSCKSADLDKTRNLELTHDELRRLLDYNPETGIFRWKVARRFPVGTIAGHEKRGKNYVVIEIRHKPYSAHRLAWFYVYGHWPPHGTQLDHINCIKNDNRLCNLRISSQSQNQANRPALQNKRSKYKGVVIKKNGLICAQITCDKKVRHLGTFKTEEDAHRAYVEAAKQLHGEFWHG